MAYLDLDWLGTGLGMAELCLARLAVPWLNFTVGAWLDWAWLSLARLVSAFRGWVWLGLAQRGSPWLESLRGGWPQLLLQPHNTATEQF